MNINTITDRFIPESFKDDIVAVNKTRVSIIMMFGFGLLLFPNFIRALRIQRPDIAIYTASAAIWMMAMPFVIKYFRSRLLAGNLFLLSFTVLLTFVTVIRGGATAYYAMNFVLVVFLSFLMTNLKNGLVWGGICTSVLVMMRIAEVRGYPFNAVSAESAHINILVIMVTITIIGLIYEWNSNSSLKLFADEKRQSFQLNSDLRDVLDEVNRVMSAVADGDLSQRIESDFKGDMATLKSSVNEALTLLSDNISKVSRTTSMINQGSGELSSAAQELASGATEQAASLEEISSSMGEIGSRAKNNADNARQARELSKQTIGDLEKGNAQMEDMVHMMNTISETSTSVSKVIKVIDEIAFQTNLLALNAAVEAARAGKYGKGFAVVAEEVRNLAVRSAEAAGGTTELIETSIRNVENGVSSANATAETLKAFVSNVSRIDDIVKEIAVHSNEQAVNVGEIDSALSQVNSVVQRNSSISEESASASRELSGHATFLQKQMEQFNIGAVQKTVGNEPLYSPAGMYLPEVT